MATKKAPAKKAAPSKATGERDDALMAKIVKDRDGGAKWSEIAAKYSITPGKAISLHDRATMKRSEKINATTEQELGKAIVALREDKEAPMSWGMIANRAGVGEGKVRSLYATFSKDPSRGARIGKGGRYPGDVNPNGDAPAKPRAAKAPAKKAATKKAAAGKAHPLEGKSVDEIREKLEGRTVKTGRVSGKETLINVVTVKSVKDNVVSVVDDTGKAKKIQIADMASAKPTAA